MGTISVFAYSNPRQFLLDILSAKQLEVPAFSVRAWAKQMGLPSHSLLVMLLQGRRPLKVKHAAFLTKGLELSTQESSYLHALLQYNSATKPEEKELCFRWLTELNPGREFRVKEMDSFIAISNWVYTAVLAMTELRNFEITPESVAERLKGKITVHQARAAIERLFSLGLLCEEENGKVKSTFQKVTTKNDIRDEGVRRYHQAASDLAKEAIESISPELREFQSSSLAIDATKIPLAKEMIRKFRSQLVKAIGSESGDEVYQLNLQFFQLTESRAEHLAQDEGVESKTNSHSIPQRRKNV